MIRTMFAAACAVSIGWGAHAADPVVLTAEAMIDVRTGQRVASPVVVVEDGIIVAAGREGTVEVPNGAERIDLGARTLLPGFIDMHTHLNGKATTQGYQRLGVSTGEKVINAIVNGQKTLDIGFTTVRNVGSGGYEITAVRDAINRGEIVGPRIFAATVSIGGTGGHCSDNNLLPPEEMAVGEGVADGPWALRAKVRQNIKYGADLIKICPTGGVLSKGTVPGIQQMTEEEIRAVVEEAHMRGLKVAAHAHGTAGIKAAIRAGVDSVEHASYLDDEAIALAKRNGTALSMDIYNTEYILGEGEKAGMLPESIEKERRVGTRQRQSFTDAVEAGAKVVFGSDSAVYPHGQNARQFSRMVKFGMTEIQAIQAATIVAGEVLGQEGRLGAIAKGYAADIVAAPGNPLSDISVLERVDFVMKDGKVHRHASASDTAAVPASAEQPAN